MIGTIALKNMLHDPARLLVTAVGIGLSLILVIIQLGLLAGFDQSISSMLDHAKADLWIVPSGTAAFDDPASLEGGRRYAALSVRGVQRITPMLVGYAEWRRPDKATTSVVVIGSDPKFGAIAPWDIQSGRADDLKAPDAVAIDASYAEQLGVSHIGDHARIEGQLARVSAITNGIRSFTTSPYVFTSLARARTYLSADPSRTSYLAVELTPGADQAIVLKRLAAKMPGVDVLTTAEFRWRNLSRWLLETGAGIALMAGAVLAVIVGTVIMTQTLYASVNDHRKEFATLRAIGSSKGFLRSVVICQAVIGTLAGSALALAGGVAIVSSTAHTSMPIHVTPFVTLVIFGLAVLMAISAALAAAGKVARVDPASVFAS